MGCKVSACSRKMNPLLAAGESNKELLILNGGLGRSPIKPGAGKNTCKHTATRTRALRSRAHGMQSERLQQKKDE